MKKPLTPEQKERRRIQQRAWVEANRARVNEANLRSQHRNIELKRAREKERYAAKREHILATTKAYAQAYPEKCLERQRRYVAANRERIAEVRRAKAAAQPHVWPAQCARRRAAKRLAIPLWAERSLIDEAYYLAKLRTADTGIVWEVDHVVPLISDVVCGLHVIENLQVIPRRCNRAKGNRWWPDMP